MLLSPGTRLGRYEISTPLGSGGMGEVYRARDLELGRDVALKVPPAAFQDDPRLRARFKREARAVAALNHENVVIVHDVGESGSALYIAFELLGGETLEDRLSRGRLSVAQAVGFAVQIAAGLAHAHEAGIVHRDLKPRNVMVTGEERIKVLDFGLGKFVAPGTANDAATTATEISRGLLMGTVGYMSPEQVRDEHIGPQSDQFVFGAVLYEMLTGRRAFQRDSTVQTLSAIIEDEPPPLAALAPRAPSALVSLVTRCLAKRPEERYAETRELARDLKAIEEALVDDSSAQRASWSRRAWIIGSATVAALLVAVAARVGIPDWRAASSPSAPGSVTLTLLPIESTDGDAAARAFWGGVIETVSTRLGALPASLPLHVTPAADVAARRVRTPDDARKELGASHVVRGVAVAKGDELRARLELVELPSSRVLRTTEVTASTANRSVLPNRLLDAVLSLVELSLTPGQRTQVAVPVGAAQADDLYLQGLGYLQDESRPENVDTAVSLFEHAIKIDANHASAHAGLGEAFWRKYGSTRDPRWAKTAREICQRAVGISEQQSAPHRCLGTVAHGMGDYEKAVEEFQHALEREPDSELARIGLATAYDSLGLAARAESTYLEAIRLRPRYWNGFSRLGAFYYGQRRYADAEKMFLRVTDLSPDSWRGHSNLGALLYVQGRTKEAVEAFEQSLKIRPNYQAASNLGTLYFFEFGDYVRASQAFREAVTLDADEYVVWGNLGSSLYWSGQQAEARKAYVEAARLAEQALGVNARDADVTMSLAEYLAALGELDRARTLIDKALTLAPGNAELMFQAGVLYEHELKNRNQALEWLGKALDAGYQWKDLERSPALAELRRDGRFEQLRLRATTPAKG